MEMTQIDPLDKKVEEILVQLSLKEKISLLSGIDSWHTAPIPRLGIPSITMTDGPYGVRADTPEVGRLKGPTTAFPSGMAMAASWDPDLIEEIGQSLAEETRAMGCDVILGPCVNIIRHPLAGRNFEALSEDPYLAGKIGTAFVKGVQSKGVATSLKHYACNNQEIERGRGNSVLDERTLREIYLAQFEMIVKEADPWTVMCSYNRINGVYASQHETLLRQILKEEWGFSGAVISDWGANHSIVDSIMGGLDLEMPGPAKYYGDLLVEAVHNWQINGSWIDDAARRMLRLVLRVTDRDQIRGSVNTPQHQNLARRTAEESITLLKNENGLLPLSFPRVKRLAVLGPNANNLCGVGGGSSHVVPPYQLNALDALKKLMNDKAKIVYEQGCDNTGQMPVIPANYLHPTGKRNNGLKAEFFNNSQWTGKPVLTQVTPNMDFWIWLPFGPKRELVGPHASVRWTGTLQVPESGTYGIKLESSIHSRLVLDGKQLVENESKEMNQQDVLEDTGEVIELNLERRRKYEIILEASKTDLNNWAFLRLSMARVYAEGEDTRFDQAITAAKKADAALVFVGMADSYETEGNDRPTMRLPNRQDELVLAVSKVNKNTIVVVNAASPIEMPWEKGVNAILWEYFPGMQGGEAIAKVLLGEINPSGKLPATIPVRLEDTPAFNNYPGKEEVIYGEGIFVGYRHYDLRKIEPRYPFGHGLSFTSFHYELIESPNVVKRTQLVVMKIRLTNTGKVSGKEVVQLYVRDVKSNLARPLKELKAFKKVALNPGEIKEITFHLDDRAFSYYDPNHHRWVVEPGEFELLIGSSSKDIRLQKFITLEK